MKLLETIAQRNCSLTGECMEKYTKEALQVTKEIMVKFIELRKVSPDNFGEVFSDVFGVVLETITKPGVAGAENAKIKKTQD